MSSDPARGVARTPAQRLSPADQAKAREAQRRVDRKAENDAWAVSGLLLSGVIVWGGAGLLLADWLHHQVFAMVGILLGIGTALYGVWARYGDT